MNSESAQTRDSARYRREYDVDDVDDANNDDENGGASKTENQLEPPSNRPGESEGLPGLPRTAYIAHRHELFHILRGVSNGSDSFNAFAAGARQKIRSVFSFAS